MRPWPLKKRETSLPRTASSAIASAETGLADLRVFFIQSDLLFRSRHRSINLGPMGNHAGREERLGNFAFACEGELRELLVPLSRWHLGIGTQPVVQCVEIIHRNPPFTEALNQVLHEVGRRLPNSRHSGTVCGTRSFEALR